MKFGFLIAALATSSIYGDYQDNKNYDYFDGMDLMLHDIDTLKEHINREVEMHGLDVIGYMGQAYIYTLSDGSYVVMLNNGNYHPKYFFRVQNYIESK